MHTRISNPASRQPLETRLVRYSLAVGALCAVPSAHAGTIYSGPLNSVVNVSNPSLPVVFDPLSGGATEFTLSVSGDNVSVTAAAGAFFDIGPLAGGAPITLANTTSSGAIKLLQNLATTPSGPWYGFSGPGYLGLSFTAGSQQYLGWAELQLDSSAPSATLLGYAYNDQAAAPINAGDTGAAPEPASLSLFALGAAGVLALRRRRARNGDVRKA
jgi:hypothetical protein